MCGVGKVPVISSVRNKREELVGTPGQIDGILPLNSSVRNKREEVTGTSDQIYELLPVISSVESKREDVTGTQVFWLYTRSTALFINEAIILLILS